jgi:hypothetical protein
VGREPLSTGANILSDVASKHPNTKVKHFVANRVTESIQELAKITRKR